MPKRAATVGYKGREGDGFCVVEERGRRRWREELVGSSEGGDVDWVLALAPRERVKARGKRKRMR